MRYLTRGAYILHFECHFLYSPFGKTVQKPCFSLPAYTCAIISFSHGMGCDMPTYLPQSSKVTTSYPSVYINNGEMNIRPNIICWLENIASSPLKNPWRRACSWWLSGFTPIIYSIYLQIAKISCFQTCAAKQADDHGQSSFWRTCSLASPAKFKYDKPCTMPVSIASATA